MGVGEVMDMVVTFLHLIIFVLAVFLLVIMYGIINHGNEQRHRVEKEAKRHWPLHHT